MTQIITVSSSASRGPKGKDGESRTGDAGADGVDGVASLAFNTQTASNATNGIVSLQSYTLAEDVLVDTGDGLIASCDFVFSVVTGVKNIFFYLNGSVAHTLVAAFDIQEGVKYATMEITMHRLNEEELRTHFKCKKYNANYELSSEITFFEDVTCNDLDATTNALSFRGQASGAGDSVDTYGYKIIKIEI